MSYDLYLRPRMGEMTFEAFSQYFGSREFYRLDGQTAIYGNQDTGVYFTFQFSGTPGKPDEPNFPLALNINFYRPSFFILEAEPEVSAVVRHFDLVAFDPQTGGMGSGEYQPELLLTGWNTGNAFGYRALLRNEPEVLARPASELTRIWKWNWSRSDSQRERAENAFIPRIFFLRSAEGVGSAVVWPDAIPAILPEVDFLLIMRKKLAPKRFFGRGKEDRVLVRWARAEPHLRPHDRNEREGAITLRYQLIPAGIMSFVQSLKPTTEAMQGISIDKILDCELVEAAREG